MKALLDFLAAFLMWIILFTTVGCIKSFGSEMVLVRDFSNIPTKYDQDLVSGSDQRIDQLCAMYRCKNFWMGISGGYAVNNPTKEEIRK